MVWIKKQVWKCQVFLAVSVWKKKNVYLGNKKLVPSHKKVKLLLKIGWKSSGRKFKFTMGTQRSRPRISRKSSSVRRPDSSSQREQGVTNYFNWNLRTSLRTADRDLTIPPSSIQRILSSRLLIFQYKTQIVQNLEDRHYASRTWFVNWCL